MSPTACASKQTYLFPAYRFNWTLNQRMSKFAWESDLFRPSEPSQALSLLNSFTPVRAALARRYPACAWLWTQARNTMFSSIATERDLLSSVTVARSGPTGRKITHSKMLALICSDPLWVSCYAFVESSVCMRALSLPALARLHWLALREPANRLSLRHLGAVALVDEGEGFLVQSGYPRVNLWPDSARALFGLENPLPQITPTWDKQYLALDENGCPFAMEPSVLRAIYVLGEREAGMDEAIIEEVPGSEAFMMLVANSYVNYLLDRDMRSEEFAMFGRISSEIPIRRIRPTTNHEDIRNLCGDIVTNAMSLVTPAWPPVLPYCR
jgi:hypothetical protein